MVCVTLLLSFLLLQGATPWALSVAGGSLFPGVGIFSLAPMQTAPSHSHSVMSSAHSHLPFLGGYCIPSHHSPLWFPLLSVTLLASQSEKLQRMRPLKKIDTLLVEQLKTLVDPILFSVIPETRYRCRKYHFCLGRRLWSAQETDLQAEIGPASKLCYGCVYGSVWKRLPSS